MSRHDPDIRTTSAEAACPTDPYRFLPILMNLEDRVRIHGTNERTAVKHFAALVRLYEAMLTVSGE